jgi:hypothetical protein
MHPSSTHACYMPFLSHPPCLVHSTSNLLACNLQYSDLSAHCVVIIWDRHLLQGTLKWNVRQMRLYSCIVLMFTYLHTRAVSVFISFASLTLVFLYTQPGTMNLLPRLQDVLLTCIYTPVISGPCRSFVQLCWTKLLMTKVVSGNCQGLR